MQNTTKVHKAVYPIVMGTLFALSVVIGAITLSFIAGSDNLLSTPTEWLFAILVTLISTVSSLYILKKL